MLLSDMFLIALKAKSLNAEAQILNIPLGALQGENQEKKLNEHSNILQKGGPGFLIISFGITPRSKKRKQCH